MAKPHEIESEPGAKPASGQPRAIASRLGTKVTWQQEDPRGFPAHRLYRLNSAGSGVAGGRRREDPPRPH